jgi:AcrR family transcriptional regulator
MSTKTNKKPVQKRSIATKKKLKKAARNLFSQNGYYKITSIQIAEAAGVPVGSFYNYFGNKKNILLELIEDFNGGFHQDTIHQMDEFIKNTIDQASAVENLKRILIQLINSPYLSDPFYKMFHALQFTEEDALQQAAKARAREVQFIEQFLNQVNNFQPIPDIPSKARLIFATGENLNLYINHLGTTVSSEQLINQAILMFERYIFGD